VGGPIRGFTGGAGDIVSVAGVVELVVEDGLREFGAGEVVLVEEDVDVDGGGFAAMGRDRQPATVSAEIKKAAGIME
jgi:hypothetical protein